MTTNIKSLVMKSVILTAEQLTEMGFSDLVELYGFVETYNAYQDPDNQYGSHLTEYRLELPGNVLVYQGESEYGTNESHDTLSLNDKCVWSVQDTCREDCLHVEAITELYKVLSTLELAPTVPSTVVSLPCKEVQMKNLKRMSQETLAKMLEVPGLIPCHGWTRAYVNKHGIDSVIMAIRLEVKERMKQASYLPVDVVYTERTENEVQLLSAFKTAKTVMFAGTAISFLRTKWTGVEANLIKDETLSDVVRVIRNTYFDKDAKIQTQKLGAIRIAIEILNLNGSFEAEELTRDSAKQVMRLKGITRPGSFSRKGVDVKLCSAGIIVRPNAGGVVGTDCLTTVLLGAEYFTEEMYSQVMTQVVVLNPDNKVIKFDNQYLTKLAMLKKYKVSLDGLGYGVKLVLKFGTNAAGKLVLEPLAFPAIALKRETVCGFMEPGKSAKGFIQTSVLSYDGLAVRLSEGSYLSTEDAKKFCARQEKLNKDRDVFKTTMQLWFLKDVPASMKSMFNTGCVYAPHSWVEKFGACRVVSCIDNGLIKGATHVATMIDPDFDINQGMVAASSYKGKLNGVMRASSIEFDLTQAITVPADFWDALVLSNGTILEAKLCTVEVLVTNPYAVERFYEQSEDEANDVGEADELALEKAVARNGFKANSAAVSMDVLQSIEAGSTLLEQTILRKDEGFVAKGTSSTITASEFEVVRNTYGRKIALEWMDCVVNSKVNKSSIAKKARGMAVLTEQYEVLKEIPLVDMVNTLIAMAAAYDVELGVGNTYTSANRNFLLSFVEAIGANVGSKSAWIKVTHNDYAVHIPVGIHLYGGLTKSSATKDSIVVEGMIGKLLAALDNVTKFKTLTDDVAFNAIESLQYEVQWKFVSKAFGKVVVNGNYFVLLPGFWLENKYDVCMPARDQYVPHLKGEEFVPANIAKHPLYFLESVSGCNVYKTIPGFIMTQEMAVALAPVLFVHPDYLLEMQNDADGDQARISFDEYVLPLYTGTVLKSGARAFHLNYIASENKFGVGDTQDVKVWDSKALHQALVDANTSKTNVGLFTDLAQKVAANIDSACAGLVDEATRRSVVAFMFTLIQECAMNAIKHNANDDMTVADALGAFNLKEIDKATKTRVGIIRAIRMVTEYMIASEYSHADVNAFAKTIVACVFKVHTCSLDMVRKVFKDTPTDSEERSGFLKLNGAYFHGVTVGANDSMFAHLLLAIDTLTKGDA